MNTEYNLFWNPHKTSLYEEIQLKSGIYQTKMLYYSISYVVKVFSSCNDIMSKSFFVSAMSFSMDGHKFVHAF